MPPFFYDCANPYGIPDVIQSVDAQTFASRFFTSLCIFLGVQKLTRTAIYPQANRKFERYSTALVSRLLLYIADKRRHWQMIVQPLMYVYSCQVHRSTSETPFSLNMSRHPSGSTTVVSSSTLQVEAAIATNRKAYVKVICTRLQQSKKTLYIHCQDSEPSTNGTLKGIFAL